MSQLADQRTDKAVTGVESFICRTSCARIGQCGLRGLLKNPGNCALRAINGHFSSEPRASAMCYVTIRTSGVEHRLDPERWSDGSRCTAALHWSAVPSSLLTIGFRIPSTPEPGSIRLAICHPAMGHGAV
eukprot:scaffold260_cov274-Pinguiococcus_pyrenoidosus.AAC.6